MSRTNLKRYLMLLAVVGLVAIASGGGSGTFAGFNAQVTNTGNTFAAGTLFLHQTPDGGTTCSSEGIHVNSSDSNTNTGSNTTNVATCTALFNNIDLSNVPAGGKTINLALNNTGSLAASNIKFQVPSCSWGKTNGSDPTFITVPTGPSACNDVYVTIQENTDATYGSNVFCAYGVSATSCGTASSANTLADTAITGSQWATLVNDVSSDPETIPAGQTRWYTITVDPVITGGNQNSLQNLTLTFDLAWQINQ